MKKICAWCQKILTEQSQHVDNNVSHGICDECADKAINNLRIPLKTFLDNIGKPVLIVDNDGNIREGNALIRNMLHKEDFIGIKGGDLLECKNAGLPEGCGNTPFCNGCKIRNTVNKTYNTGKPYKNVTAFIEKYDKDQLITTPITFSTKKVNDYVLLQIHGTN